MQNKKLYVLLIAIMLLIIELCSLCVLYFAEEVKGLKYAPVSNTSLTERAQDQLRKLANRELDYLDFDPVLGWAIKPNGKSGLYSANAQGI